MLDDLMNLMAARRGHFLLESGHHGELWLDVDRMFRRPRQLQPLIAELAQLLAPHDPEVLCGPLTGGAFAAQMVAEELDVDFVYAGRGPRHDGGGLFAVDYRLPEMFDNLVRHRRVAIVNDVINAGSAVRGALTDLARLNAQTVAIASVLALGDAASELAAGVGVPLVTLMQVPNQVWAPAACPLCAAGAPLTDLVD